MKSRKLAHGLSPSLNFKSDMQFCLLQSGLLPQTEKTVALETELQADECRDTLVSAKVARIV